ncbi:SET domain-containing protein [Cucurbitaria berberidis CBS 394.84]|uniref:SET domain-containing protein n=1 Tax=Cucurbitaria berberidis CBS 394.84 TaxID=1168544 RepID=A0A9P4GIJ0_9PLEO|nr:SET domain-containing protein [Cucurbitaria berberidis CBS 394.84]KAF1846104.1 SET domain-containing protein [Cucurbitaria berberidis CBS 394.84]
MASQNERNTIFLTEQEAERIRHTVKERSKNCLEKVGHAREPRDQLAAHQQATGAALMADMGGAPDPDMTHTKGRGDTIPVVAVGQPYPPCTVSLEDLQPMKMADLLMDTHHRGRKLTIKRSSPVVTLVARSWTMVQDEELKETERLEMCLHKSRHDEDVLESAKHFIIKEPYFTLTDQGEATIRIDHPSDLVVYQEEAHGKTQVEDSAAAEKLATKYKTQGNAALKKQDLPLAHAKYTEGLNVAKQPLLSDSNPDLARDISRNRAYVNLLLNQLDEVKTDARASLTGKDDQRSKDLDSKAFYRAGSAAYSQGRYQEAKRFFEEQQKLTPDDKDAKVQLKKIASRLREQDSGTYDFMKISTGLSKGRPRVDAATFIKNTEIKDSAGRGRGLYATRSIAPGEIVMCEKAFCVVWGHESEALTAMTYDVRDDKIRVSPVGLGKSIVQKLLSNPSQIESVMDLYGDYEGDGKAVSETEEGAVVDVFRVHDIMSRNAFGPGSQHGEEGARNASTGLWIHAAYINHSCIANAEKEYIGDLMILRAARPIQAGEEIFHSYDESQDYDARKAALMTTWGFECSCAFCAAEKADGRAVRDKRMELVGEADAFVEKTPWAGAKRLTIRKAQRLAQSIDETYDGERYKDLPRTAGGRIQEWLAKASPRK